jgi:hypothetical protein
LPNYNYHPPLQFKDPKAHFIMNSVIQADVMTAVLAETSVGNEL